MRKWIGPLAIELFGALLVAGSFAEHLWLNGVQVFPHIGVGLLLGGGFFALVGLLGLLREALGGKLPDPVRVAPSEEPVRHWYID